jgi:hypothetical protein
VCPIKPRFLRIHPWVIIFIKNIIEILLSPAKYWSFFVEPMALIAKEYKAGKLELAVFCTDGYGDQETLTSKVKFDKRFVWLIINNPGFKAPFGKVVHITTKNSK